MKALYYDVALGIRTEEFIVQSEMCAVCAVGDEEGIVFSGYPEDLVHVRDHAFISGRRYDNYLKGRVSGKVSLDV